MSKQGVIVKFEPVDVARLNKLIEYKKEHESEEDPVKTQIDRLETYLSKVSAGKVKVTYNFTSKTQIHEWGRVYAEHGVSLQMMKRDIRGYLACDYGIDVDMVNAHPNILLKIAQDNQCRHTALKQYVTQRDEILEQVQKVYKVDRDAAKQAFLMMIYLGSIKDWEYWLKSEGYDVDLETAHEKKVYQFMKAYESELMDIADVVSSLAPDMRKVYELENPGKSNKKVMAGVLAWYVSNIEHKILMEMDAFMAMNNRKVITLVYDGFIVQKRNANEHGLPMELLTECERHALKKTGHIIKLVVKSFESKYNTLIPCEKVSREQMDQLDYDDAIDVLKTNMDLMYPDKKYLFERFTLKIRSPACYVTIKKADKHPIIRAKKELLESFSTILVYKVDTGDKTSFIQQWVHDEKIREYEEMDFLPPPRKCPRSVFNMWRGFAIESAEGDASLGSVEPFLSHTRILAGHDEACYKYMINFIAHLIQRPGEITGTALVILGRQGCGKNWWVETIGKIIGLDHTSEIRNAKRELFCQFSNARMNKLLVNIDEVEQKGVSDFTEEMKNMITSETMRYEQKNMNPIVLSNFNRFIYCTNNDVPFHFNDDNRRYFVTKASAEKCKNTQYFTQMRKYRADNNNLKAIHAYLLSVDLNGFDWINDMPCTEAAKDIQKHSIDDLHTFLERMAVSFIRKNLETVVIPCPEFMNQLEAYVIGDKRTFNKKSMLSAIGKQVSAINDAMNITKDEKNDVFRRTQASGGGRVYHINVRLLEKYLLSKNLLSEYAFMFIDDGESTSMNGNAAGDISI